MTRRSWALIAALIALFGAVLVSALPARASHTNAIDPSQIDPTWLRLPNSALPPGSVLDHDAVSPNSDANNNPPSSDGFPTALRILHQTAYDVLGRITGYRMDFHYTLQGAAAGTEYLASIYPDAAKATAAMNDAIGPGSLIQIIGQPLAHQCSVGDACAAFSGPQPGTTNNAVAAIFRHGPIVVETATHVPTANFTALEPALETSLYGFLAAADVQVTIALNGGPKKATNTPEATSTSTATPTATATPTDTPTVTPTKATTTKKCTKHASRKHGKCTCKKGYVMKKGKCVKKHK